ASLGLLSPGVAAVASTLGASISLTPDVGPPTAETVVAGAGFQASEVVDLLFDGDRVGRVHANGAGEFSRPLATPSSALPGEHQVMASGEASGATAQSPFLIRTDWPHKGFDDQHSSFNRYENVVGPSNV